jgi:sugar phosphate isomerase/epimerase
MKMKLGVFTVMLPDLTPEEAIQELQVAGYQGVEWRMTHVPPERQSEQPSFWGNNLCTLAPTEADARRGRALAEAAGLEVINLGTYLKVGDLNATEEAMRLAQLAGSPQIRIGVGRPSPETTYSELFAMTQAYLAEVEGLARQYQVKGLIETHPNTICPSAGLTHRLVSTFDPDCIGVIYDAGNMVYEGFEDYWMGLELLGPYLAHVHLKNAAFARLEGSGVWTPYTSPLEDGVVDFPKFFSALRAVGYEGWFGLEDFSAVRPSHETLRHDLAFIQETFRQSAG